MPKLVDSSVISRNIQFSDNIEGIAGSKEQNLLEKLLKKFKSLYTPDEYVCVDETMLPFRGILSIQQTVCRKAQVTCKTFQTLLGFSIYVKHGNLWLQKVE